MGNRRFKAVAVSDDEDDLDNAPITRASTRASEEKSNKRKRKTARIEEEEEEEVQKDPEEEEEEEQKGRGKRNGRKVRKVYEEPESDPEPEQEEEEEQPEEDAKPVGDVVQVTGKGKSRRNHYKSFDYDGNIYELEDPVLLVPEGQGQKPYVAIIKDITQTKDGNMMVTGQWFYRPEEALKKSGGNWKSQDSRDLFYSFHRDEVPAESVMHKCVVHFIPLNKQIPSRKQHPGFIVQKVYDTDERRLFKLTDKDYEDNKQHEIDLLVQKTMARVGHLPDIEPEDNSAPPVGQEEQWKSKRLLRKKSIAALDVSRDDGPTRSGQSKAETPGSCVNNSSEYFAILSKFKVLTGETQRDKWLDKLLQSIQSFWGNPVDNTQEKGGSDVTSLTGKEDNGANSDKFQWPDTAVPAVVALEKAAHETLSCDFQKYNQKMRQLTFNLKNSPLARRLLNGELDPPKILNMSPNELKEGLTAEEIASREPDEPEPIQMTDARCKRCTEKKVRLMEIIQAGHGDRYHLECIPCGNTWYASRDEAASLTIDGPQLKSVGTESLAIEKGANEVQIEILQS